MIAQLKAFQASQGYTPKAQQVVKSRSPRGGARVKALKRSDNPKAIAGSQGRPVC